MANCHKSQNILIKHFMYTIDILIRGYEMSKFKEEFDKALIDYSKSLNKIMQSYQEINENTIFDKSHFEIAKMIPDYADRGNYCDTIIDLYEKNINYLYEEYTINDFSNKHRKVIVISIIASGFIALTNQLSLTLIGGGALYAFLTRRELRKHIDGISFHEGHVDSINDIKLEIKKIEELRRS